ncbi:hypothetical protein DB88DRAFT_477090 [Papiliotrema laurentii]|uniref:Uncharacterized protein n=1 Tax=Papiliotrema laurentii TaxID=5418 RepID=A0AAD9L959_PAPLA|nr:hypothetical protein DB88DRAFT_477090 [Papiliotrema laurentii]
MASTWDIISSTLILVIFLAVVYLAVKLSGSLSKSTSATRSNLSSRGVTYQDGRLSVKTDRAAPSREEYIAKTQRAFEKGAKTLSANPGAFRTGPSREASAEPHLAAPVPAAASSSVETPERKGFRRTKKLA